MVMMVNNSERPITLINVMLVPGIPIEVSDELLKHPGVQRMMKGVTEKNTPVLEIVSSQEQTETTAAVPEEVTAHPSTQPTEAELLAKAQHLLETRAQREA